MHSGHIWEHILGTTQSMVNKKFNLTQRFYSIIYNSITTESAACPEYVMFICPSVKNMKKSYKQVKKFKFFCTCIHSFIPD